MRGLVLTFVLLLLTAYLGALPVGSDRAVRVARNFLSERMGTDFTVADATPLGSGYPESYIYVVNVRPQGYVLVSANDAAYPFIGYSVENNWGDFELPAQLDSLIRNWNDELHFIRRNDLRADLPTSLYWSRYDLNPIEFIPNRNFRDVAPMITARWGQGTYYNAQCPAGTPVGCVATSMSMIMRYWSYPQIGQGSHSYNHPVYGTQSANFGETVYNWSAMPHALSSHNSAVATICRHTGVAVNMDYAPGGSGAYSTAVPPALISYFKYKNTAQLRYKQHYSDSNWATLLRGELDNARPVYYAGSSTGSGGHAWVLDGYQGTDHFHMNWGWYGYYNGYYYLSNLNPGSDNFTDGQQAVIGIEPAAADQSINEGFEGATFPPTGWTRSHTSWVRSTTTFITGSASAYLSATGNINDRRLITPLLTINGSVPLVFKARRGSTARNEVITIRYSTNGSTWTNLSSYTLTATATTYTQALTALAPGDYYLSFSTSSTNTNANQAKTFVVDDVTGPPRWINPNPTPALNITSWNAGAVDPGGAASSGLIFRLSNVTGGTLTVNSITNLSGTEFSTTFNPGIALVTGQSHEFGFTYEPLNYGVDNVTFQIVTNGGTVQVSLSGMAIYLHSVDGFETYSNFALSFPPWTQYDGDGSTTYGFSNVTFTNSGYTGSYIIFNASQTSPSLAGTAADARTGAKHAACFAATAPPNNDWLISPAINFGTNPGIGFYAKSYTSDYGLERFKVLWSTTGNQPANFTNYLAGSATTYIEAPTAWTLYYYPLPPALSNATGYIAIQCVSNDAFIFMVDDFGRSDDEHNPPTPQFGNLSGYVYRYGTTTPIQGAQVQVGSKYAYTNSSGFYQVNNLLVGTYDVACTTPGMFYFSSTATGVVINQGATASRNFSLTWAELEVNPQQLSASLYSSQTADVNLAISNPGGTANLQYQMYFTTAPTASRSAETSRKLPADQTPGTRPFRPEVLPEPDRTEGWAGYADPADAYWITTATAERAVKFYLEDFGLFATGVTISKLRHYFYNDSNNPWGSDTTYRFRIYAANGSTVLYTSPILTAIDWPTVNEHVLTAPINVTDDFWVAVVPVATSGKPNSVGVDYSYGCSFYGSAGSWTQMDFELLTFAYIQGSEWASASQYSGTVVPGGTQNINIHFDSAGLPAGTKNAYLHIYNNSNYIAPSPPPSLRGDVMVIPVSLQVTIPTEPTAVLNTNTWTTSTNVGTPSSSGDLFQLTNVGPGTLTVTSATGLTGTAFSTNFNTGISLGQNQSHNFGFTFNPGTGGLHTATYSIVTNGGTKNITLKGYANYILESFEGATFPPDGWIAIDNDADGYNWFSFTVENTAHTGTKSAASASYLNGVGPLTPDNWLITPRLAITSGDELAYWIAAQDAAWPQEHYSVKISTTTSQLSAFTTTLFSETLVDDIWIQRTLSLNDYAGQNVYIAFVHHNCTDWFYLKLDDVLMPPLAAPLVFGSITGRVRFFGTDNHIQSATVSVAGRQAVTNEEGLYTIENIVADTYQLTASATGCVTVNEQVIIPANDILYHNVYMNWRQAFTPQTIFNVNATQGQQTSVGTTLSNVGTATLDWDAASGIWGGDVHPGAPLNQTFEDLNLTGWSGSVAPDSDIYTGYGYNSTRTWVFVSDGYTQPQYLITPKLRVSGRNNLSFWYRQYNNSGENLSILVSTTDTAIASFTNTLATIGPLDNTNWQNFSQSLAAYANQDIYIAFYYPRVDGNEFGYLFIDEITGPIQILPPQGWLSCTPAEGTLAASQGQPLTLNIDATGLPTGSYSAQTWIFSNGINSPYKLYVNMVVQVPQSLDPPQNLFLEKSPGVVGLGWDDVLNAQSYHIFVSDNPNGPWIPLGTTDLNGTEITEAELLSHGIDLRAFFHVKADTAPARFSAPASVARSGKSSQLLDTLSLTPPRIRLRKLK